MNNFLVYHKPSRSFLTSKYLKEWWETVPKYDPQLVIHNTRYKLTEDKEGLRPIHDNTYQLGDVFFHEDFKLLPHFDEECLDALHVIIEVIPEDEDILDFLDLTVKEVAFKDWVQRQGKKGISKYPPLQHAIGRLIEIVEFWKKV